MFPLVLVALLLLAVLGFVWNRERKASRLARGELAALKEKLPPDFSDIVASLNRLKQEHAALEAEIQGRRTEWEKNFSQAMEELQRLQGEVEGLDLESEMQSFGLYQPRFSFASAARYGRRAGSPPQTERATARAVFRGRRPPSRGA